MTYSQDNLLDSTYTIRRLGCTAWAQGLRAADVAERLADANNQVPGHVVIGESGPVEGEIVSAEDIADAVESA